MMIPETPENYDYITGQRLGPSLGPYFMQMMDLLAQHLQDKEQHINTAKIVEDEDARKDSKNDDSDPRLPRSKPGK